MPDRYRDIKRNELRKRRLVIITAVLLAVCSAVSLIAYRFAVHSIQLKERMNFRGYKYHFMMIVEDRTEPFWLSAYETAKAEGRRLDAYVELAGSRLPGEYSAKELMEIAVEQRVDGILLEPPMNDEMREEIDQAVLMGIPVITMFRDVSDSARQCFVGVSNYYLGQVYGQELLRLSGEKRMEVMVLLSGDSLESRGQNLIYAGIKEAVEGHPVDLKMKAADRRDAFSSEEAIRKIIVEDSQRPDVIICMNTLDTQSAYQAVVDYNKVGDIRIIGTYDSREILSAIQKGVIDATITIDAAQTGSFGVQALAEYIEHNRVSGYLPLDIKVISEENVGEYLARLEVKSDEERQ